MEQCSGLKLLPAVISASCCVQNIKCIKCKVFNHLVNHIARMLTFKS